MAEKVLRDGSVVTEPGTSGEYLDREGNVFTVDAGAAPAGRIMSSLVNHGGLAAQGGLAGQGGGLAG